MRCKIRYLTLQRAGHVAQEQIVVVEGRRVTFGRGTDSNVFLRDLRVNYHHAQLIVRDSDAVLEAVGHGALRVDRLPVERAVVTPSSEIEIGPYRMGLGRGDDDADITLTVELVSPPPIDTVERLVAPRRVRLGGGLLRKRPLSWLLFALVISGGLVLPILASRTPAPDSPTRGGSAGQGADGEQGARGGLGASGGLLAGFDRVWLSGELSAAHKHLADNCKACHEQPFVQVESEACGACHTDTRHHFDTERFQLAGFAPTDCMACHVEHQGPRGIVPTRQSLCADCHGDLVDRAPSTMLLDVADFGLAQPEHPEFRPSVITDPASGRIERGALGTAGLPKERSNLEFSHAIHLTRSCPVAGVTDPEQLKTVPAATLQGCNVLQQARQTLSKDGLICADCHQPEPGGVHMLRARMQDHCAACHRLQFDPAAPERVLPHGKPDEVIAVINDFYAARALGGPQPAAEPQAGIRRRPGGGDVPADAIAAPPDPTVAAREKAAKKLDDVFGRALCGVCHEIVRPAESARGKWEVRPVRVASLWLPKAHFDHAAHRATPCAGCHDAAASTASQDVLLPGIKVCRGCHEGEQASAAVPSTCIMCHVYHRDDLGPMLPPQGASAHDRTAGG